MEGSRWKAGVKRFLFWLFYYSGLELLIARCIKVDAAAVIMYHGVCNDSRLPPEVDFHLTADTFDRHLRMLQRRYPVISLRQLLERLECGEPLQKAVVITFDDGYRNNATVAHPILERHSLPYTIFISTAYIGNGQWLPLNQLYALWHFGRITGGRMKELRQEIRRRPASDASQLIQDAGTLKPAERELAENSFGMLSWDEVRHLAAQGVEFGSHTHTHCNMTAETRAQQLAELQLARDLIRAETGEDATTFAYPFGRSDNWNQETRASVIAAGHRCAILANGGLVKPRQDVFALPRVGYGSKEAWAFACQLTLLFLKDYLNRKDQPNP
jgi:peptidoglycan/xylan/chitin deacetylase (PgdA/CDA1 family)